MQKQQESDDDRNDLSAICPSFNSYSSSSGTNSNKITEIAIKVGDEFRNSKQNCSNSGIDDEYEEEDDEFEFALIDDDDTDLDFTLVSDDDSKFHRPMFPVFNRELMLKNDDDCKAIQKFESESSPRNDGSTIQISLKNLLLDDRDIPSSSSSEIDELDGVKPETYCVWIPKSSIEPSPERCKKSNSTGSSSKLATKRWSLRALLRRSNSDGKTPFVYLTKKSESDSSKAEKSKQNHDSYNNDKDAVKSRRNSSSSDTKVVLGGKKVSTSSAHEVFYMRNRAMKEGDKRRSYLPYRQDIVGIFANNIHGFSLTKTFPPF